MFSRRYALPFFLASLCMPVLAQPDSEPARNPPVWPTPSEYLSKKDAAVQESTPPELVQDAPDPVPVPTSSPVVSGGVAYTVQVAAFLDLALARRTARDLGDSGAAVRSSLRDGESWYSVTLGLFDTREAALAAEAVYLEANPGKSAWVRSTAGLQPLP